MRRSSIYINDEPSFSDHISKGVIHESLERCRRVGESKEHHGGFEESFVCDEGSFPLVAIFDADIVVSPADIKLSEQFEWCRSWCLNTVSNFMTKLENVPMVMVVPEIAFCLNVVAHVRADPLVM